MNRCARSSNFDENKSIFVAIIRLSGTFIHTIYGLSCWNYLSQKWLISVMQACSCLHFDILICNTCNVQSVVVLITQCLDITSKTFLYAACKISIFIRISKTNKSIIIFWDVIGIGKTNTLFFEKNRDCGIGNFPVNFSTWRVSLVFSPFR